MTRWTVLFFTTVFLGLTVAHGQTPKWHWGKGSIGNNYDEGYSIATDKLGNIYAIGYFTSNPLIFGNDTLINAGQYDVFLTKYDSNGNVQWAKSFGSTQSDNGMGVAVDTSGNIYVTGFFSSTMTVGTTTLTSNGSQDIFLVKYNALGNVLWAKSAGGASSDFCYGVSSDVSGNTYIVGWFNSPTISFGSYTLSCASYGNIFIVKYSPLGNVLWAESPIVNNSVAAKGIATDNSGNIYIVGDIGSSSMSFGSYTLTNPGGDNVFLVKFDSSGNVIWGKTSQGGNSSYGLGVAADAFGNSIITGRFEYSSNIFFGTFTLTNVNPNNNDVFVVKYDSLGNVLWANSGNGTGDDQGYSVATDNSGNVYAVGGYGNNGNQHYPITFGSSTLSYPTGAKDPMYIVKYDSIGNIVCISSLTSGGDDNCSVITDVLGNAYICGDYWVTPFIVGSDTLPANSGNESVFIAKYSCEKAEGVSEINKSSLIKVFPNPFSSQTTLQTTVPLKNATLTVDNCFGQTVAQIKNICGQTITFHRENLASGLYFVRLTQDNKTFSADKLVITDN